MSCCDYYYWSEEMEQQFKEPMPLIGIYIAAASLVCSLAMAADVFHGLRHRKLWFPCKFFTLNAATLTILAVAVKLTVDLTTSMPGTMDQLAKLSSSVLMTTAIGNFMPSLGPMDNREIFMNITALAILVITIFANICIQLRTHLLSPFYGTEHIAVMSFMLVLLVILSFSALTVPTTKNYIQLKYSEIHKIASSEESEGTGKFTVEKLKDDVKKCWMMAETGSPQFVMARSVTCSASGAICFLTAFILAEAELRTFTYLRHAYNPRNCGSDYKWSTFLVLVIQSIGVGVGTIAPAFRWFSAIRLKSSKKRGKSYKTELKIEDYWIERLVGWKESPLALQVRGKKCRKFVHNTKNLILAFSIKVQIVIVTTSKLVLLISILFIRPLLSCWHSCKGLKRKLVPGSSASNNHTGLESEPGKLDFCRYVLHLAGEEQLPLQMMNNYKDATGHLIQMGKKQHPKYLKELLEKSIGFNGVAKFDSDQVPSQVSEEPPNCWTLLVVTLASITMALPKIENHKVERLHRSVSEGLLYVSLVEKTLYAKGDLVNIKNAADIVWLGVDLFRKWLDEDLQKIALQGKTSKQTLERLSDIAKNKVMEFKANMNGNLENSPNCPIKIIAANSMYRISNAVLLDNEGSKDESDERLFEQLSIMMADILGACLSNLPRVIAMKCFCSAIEEREKSVLRAAHLLGESEEILKIVQRYELPNLNPDELAYIDKWHALVKQNIPLPFALSNNGMSFSGSGELHIAVE